MLIKNESLDTARRCRCRQRVFMDFGRWNFYGKRMMQLSWKFLKFSPLALLFMNWRTLLGNVLFLLFVQPSIVLGAYIKAATSLKISLNISSCAVIRSNFSAVRSSLSFKFPITNFSAETKLRVIAKAFGTDNTERLLRKWNFAKFRERLVSNDSNRLTEKLFQWWLRSFLNSTKTLRTRNGLLSENAHSQLSNEQRELVHQDDAEAWKLINKQDLHLKVYENEAAGRS